MGQLNSLVFPAPRPSYSANDFKIVKEIPNIRSTKHYPIPIVVINNTDFGSVFEDGKMILFFHGNAEDIGLTFDFINEFASQLGMNVVIPEYRGYGIHRGKPSEKAIINDAEIVYEHLIGEMKIPEENLILFGRSLGSGPATHIASKYNPRAMILMSAYTSIKAVASNMVGAFFSSMLSERFRNIDKFKKVKCPKILIHGKKDTLIPLQHSIDLRNSAPELTEYWYPNEMTHNNFDIVMDILLPVDNFFQKYGIIPS